ncbi:MAG: phosphate signaling complex protein PhoU [Candidatus Omnitrophica bacterium]|nr:phosphate signaling complex protein PhoU [Candidatus Omnitrophota bacterium]
MDRHLDEELEAIKTDLLKMAVMVEEAIHLSIQALIKQDARMASRIIAQDKEIDEMENRIEERIIDALALFQPFAGDLRFMTTAMHINTELERIADLTVNISQRVLELSDQPILKPLIDIPRLGAQAKFMVRSAIDSFVKHDEKMALDVIMADKTANQLRTLVIQELIYDYMVKDSATVTRAVPLLLLTRDLERICDHAAAIAEDVIYMVQARMVKHKRDVFDVNSEELNN